MDSPHLGPKRGVPNTPKVPQNGPQNRDMLRLDSWYFTIFIFWAIFGSQYTLLDPLLGPSVHVGCPLDPVPHTNHA